MKIDGFDWDAVNLAKCQKHGVSVAEIEALFRSRSFVILPDLKHSLAEERLKAIGRSDAGRWIAMVFTFRVRNGLDLVRPVTVRYMHAKEVAEYEKTIPRFDV